ncbi:MAG TPA: 2-amino-4-hydroxy-6-hydroxymethyldihydropteridine diphosphokinase [Terriglobales bacterium]|nr:2-amino-4-hydroxy-6-hydroxymethyldihydropteridine diphosphokinase [Terriglobales bacterium]
MTVYLALGANRGHPAAQLRRALAALPALGLRVSRVSALRATAPAPPATGRRRFLNGVAEVHTRLLPQVLLRRLRALERRHGRHRGAPQAKKTPRSLDLDVILYGRARIRTPALAVPHPRFLQRRFVLQGMAELAPRRRAPGHARSMRQALHALGFPSR